MKWADCQHHVFLKKRVLHVGTSLNDSFWHWADLMLIFALAA
jgi:hypothetical protein